MKSGTDIGRHSHHLELSFLSFDIGELFLEVRNSFPNLDDYRIDVSIQEQKPLACIHVDRGCAHIQLHSVLNHPETPRDVLAYILKHELLHIVIPPKEIENQWKPHPPEFWESLRLIEPNSVLLTAWLHVSFEECLRNEKKRDGQMVKSNWKKKMNGRRLTLTEIANLANFSELAVKASTTPLF
jgi:hypothetical protein